MHFSSEAERRGFDSFRQYPANIIGDGLRWRDLGSIVLQNSESDPALRHAVAALGAAYEAALQTPGEPTLNGNKRLLSLAYKQYQQAIRTLRIRLQHNPGHSIETNMLACMLLVVFDFIQGDDRGAAAHMAGGLSLLRAYIPQSNVSQALIDRLTTPWRISWEGPVVHLAEASFSANLLLSYGYLDFLGCYWTDGLPYMPEVSVLEGLEVRGLKFRDPSRACTELELCFEKYGTLENRIREFLHAARGSHRLRSLGSCLCLRPCSGSCSYPVSATFAVTKSVLVTSLTEWHLNLQHIVASDTQMKAWEKQAIKYVAVNHKKIQTMLLAIQADGTVDYRAFTPAFQELLTLARRLYEEAGFPESSPFVDDSPFAFTWGTIHPLYITALHCNDVSVCREAIEILSSRHWRDGGWDSFVMANIARRELAERK